MWLRERSEDSEHDLGVDPCPDCDVRFNRETTKLPIMAGTSILGF